VKKLLLIASSYLNSSFPRLSTSITVAHGHPIVVYEFYDCTALFCLIQAGALKSWHFHIDVASIGITLSDDDSAVNKDIVLIGLLPVFVPVNE